MGRQLDRLMPFWQPANILHSVLIFMLLWQINVVVVVGKRKCSGRLLEFNVIITTVCAQIND